MPQPPSDPGTPTSAWDPELWSRQIAEHFDSPEEALCLIADHARAVRRCAAEHIEARGMTAAEAVRQLRTGFSRTGRAGLDLPLSGQSPDPALHARRIAEHFDSSDQALWLTAGLAHAERSSAAEHIEAQGMTTDQAVEWLRA